MGLRSLVGGGGFAFALLATMATLASTASAAPSGPTAADRETARALMDQARDLRDKGNLKDALKRFQAANDIMHVPTTALEVARADVALGLLVEARDAVAAIRQMPATRESAVFKEARAKADELDSSLAGRVPAVTITLKGAEPSQEPELAIDGVSVPAGVLGLPRSVDPGHHVITAKTPAGAGQQEIDIKEGEQKPVEVTLLATAATDAVVPETPAVTTPDAPPQRSHSPTTLTYIGIGVAGAGIIMGTVTGVLVLGKKSTLKSDCMNDICGSAGSSALDSANTLATLSDVGFGIAGAGAVLAIVTLVRGHDVTASSATPVPSEGSPPSDAPPASDTPPPTARIHFEPWIAGSMAGIHGSF